jgi:hypothetical protein
MKITRPKRIALELLGPPAIGVMVVVAVTEGHALWAFAQGDGSWLRQGGLFKDFWILILIAYVFAGLQSLVYTLVMEWRFSHGLDPRSGRAVVWSTTLGFLSGAAIVLAYGLDRSDQISICLFFGGIGTAVGYVMGLLIRWLSPSANTPNEI